MTHNTKTLADLLAALDPDGIEKSAAEVSATAPAQAVDATAEQTQEPSALIKQAADAGAALAQEIMEKIASNMTAQTPAQAAGTALGQALLDTLTKQAAEKQAGVGDVTTTDGASGTGGVPVKSQRDNAAMVAEADASIKPMPTGDGIKNQGTATDIYNAIVADMTAQGGTPTTAVPDGPEVDGSGNKAVPNQVKTAGYSNIEKMAAIEALVADGADFETALEHVKAAEAYLMDQHEKMAAVQALVAEGIDFDEAANLVKQAAEDLVREEISHTKQAALAEMVANGVDFDQAVELIKQAGVGDVNTMDGVTGTDGVPTKPARDNAALIAEHDASIKPMPTGDGMNNQGTATDIYNAIVADMLAQGGTPTSAVADGPEVDGSGNAAVPNQVKTASLATIIASGVDFDTACNMVKEAAKKTMEAKKDEKPAKGKMDKKEMFMKKKAAFDQLIADGVDFIKAAALIEAKSKELFGE
jgi:hypothetical protein